MLRRNFGAASAALIRPQEKMTQIHKFNYKDKFILLDIPSSNVFEIDELTYDILDYFPEQSEEAIYSALGGKYSAEELREALSELTELKQSGLLFAPERVIDLSLTKYSSIKAMCLNITHDCNLACKYCFASGGDYHAKRELMSFETAKASIDFLVSASKSRRNLEVDFFGGEPLMNFEVVKQTVRYARSIEEQSGKNFRFTITTNAMLIDDDVIDFCNAEMKNVVLSMDGRKEVNDDHRPTRGGGGSYDRIVPKIQKMAASRGTRDFYVRGTYTSDNLDFASDVEHMAKLGLKSLSVEPVVADPAESYAITEANLPAILAEYDRLVDIYLDCRGTKDEFSFFHFNIDLENSTCDYKKVAGCGAGSDYVAVTPSGDIYPCHQFVGVDGFVMGSVFDGKIDESVRSRFSEVNLQKKEHCSTCWARFFCGGGCHANSYNDNGNVNGIYPLGCEMHKKRLECALYLKCVQKDVE